jgi:hypothetical protein
MATRHVHHGRTDSSKSLVLQSIPVGKRCNRGLREDLAPLLSSADDVQDIRCTAYSSYAWITLKSAQAATSLLQAFYRDEQTLSGGMSLRRPFEYKEDPRNVLPTTPELEKRYCEFLSPPAARPLPA